MINSKNVDFVDGLSFFNNEIVSRHFPYFLESPLAQKIGWRIFGLRAWRAGKITFGEAVRNFLPGKYKNEKIQQAVHLYIDEKLERIFRSKNLYESGAVGLFGKQFLPPTLSPFQAWLALFKTLAEAIVTDQYHARKFIKKNSIVIEGGAFIGAFSVFAATLAPKGHVYSFEPTFTTHAVLQKNTVGYSNITTIHGGLGDKSDKKELIINSDVPAANTFGDSGMVSLLAEHSSANKENVEINTIDEFVKKHAIPRVDFIKLDTEGYEARIIDGAKETIKKYKPAIAMSAYHHVGDNKLFPSLITAIYPGYKWKLIKGLEEDFIFWID